MTQFDTANMAVKGFKEWLGEVDTTSLPSNAEYDRITFAKLTGYQERVGEGE